MISGIYFQRCVLISRGDNLLEIHPQEGSDRTGLFVLVHMPKLMRKQPKSAMPLADIYPVTQSQSNHVGPK